MQNQLKSLAVLLFKFSTQQGKTRKKFINIAKMIQNQKTNQSPPSLNSTQINNLNQKPSLHSNPESQANIMERIFDDNWQQNSPESSQPTQMSTQEQQLNQKIRSAIRCETIYHECTKKKHKLEPRHYALMFCKVLQLRKNVPKERKETQAFTNFLSIIDKKLQKMAPEELVRIIYAMKKEGVNKQEIKLFKSIIEKIVNQFSNTQNTEFDPKSFETFKLSTSIKLFKSFAFLLEQTGSYFEDKIKQIMNETLNYILFQAMKTKRFSKTGEYFPLNLKIGFLSICKHIEASAACVRNLILSVLIQKQKLSLETLLDLQATIFATPDVLQRTRHQLIIEKQIHIKFNIFYRIQHYIQKQIPPNLNKSSNYELLTKKLVKHLSYMSEFTFEELKIMEMTSQKDEQVFKVLSLFHEAYRNCLIENFPTVNDKEDAMVFFNKSEHQEYALYELLNFFYLKLKKDGPNSLRPSTKKQLKDFVNLLTKFYGKLSFMTQSIIIELLVMSNFSNIKHVMIEFLTINTLAQNSLTAYKGHFLSKDPQNTSEKFLQMIKYESSFRQNCPVQYDVFMKSNLRSVMKFIFKSKQQINTEKYAFYLASYCRPFNQQQLKSFVDEVIQIYIKQSWTNRSFAKDHVDVIYKNQEYFLSTPIEKDPKQLENQADIFGQNLLNKEHTQTPQKQRLLPTLQNDKQFMREFYVLEQRIRQKLRNLLKNFKFLIMILENIKLTVSKEVYSNVISQELYKNLLLNFKTELECMKFQRLLTKQNCTEISQIYEFLKDIWNHTVSGVQIRNEFLMHKNEQIKDSKIEKEGQKPNQNQVQSTKSQGQQNQTKAQELLDQEEDESEQHEYTEEIEYLKGKDLIESDTLRVYKERQQKTEAFFMFKNEQCLGEIKKLTKEFTQFPKTIQKVQQKVKILKKIQEHYVSERSKEYKSETRVKDLSSIDGAKISQQNLSEVLSINLQNIENRVIHTLKVFTKQFPTLQHILEAKKYGDLQNQQLKVSDKIYYVHSSKSRRNKKRLEQISQIPVKDTPIDQSAMDTKQAISEEKEPSVLGQGPNEESL